MAPRVERLPCIGVVLAGGQSSRMGQDKALLCWQGRPLIERQVATLRAAGVNEVCVSGERPGYAGVPDATPHRGPLGGLEGVARAIARDADLLLIPVDMPLLQPALLRRLREEQPAARSLIFADHVLPMRWRLDAAGREVLLQLLRLDDPRQHSLRGLHQASQGELVALEAGDMAQLVDCNTPSQWNEVAG